MQKEADQEEVLSPEVQDVMRQFIAALRAVKLYPANNPICAQSVKKAYDVLVHFLATNPAYNVGVQKTYFTYQGTPVGKDAQLNNTIAQDLFMKGIREIVFSTGLLEVELLEICRALALSTEEMAMKSGISSIIWEKGMDHVKVMESDLEDVVTSKTSQSKASDRSAASPEEAQARREKFISGRTMVLGDLMNDPSGFADGMLELANRTRGENESVEDRLFALYKEAGNKISAEHADESDAMFQSLAKSVLSLDPNFRDALVAGKLYRDLDTEMAGEQTANDQDLPTELHEIEAARFSHDWNIDNVATLLKKASSKKSDPPIPLPTLADLKTTPLPSDLLEIVRELAEYTPAEMSQIKVLGETGSEADIIDSVIRTLKNLLLFVKRPSQTKVGTDDVTRFSGLVSQLETMLNYLLNKADYLNARPIVEAFQMPVDPAFKSRLQAALKKATPKTALVAAINDMRKNLKSSSVYKAAYAYVSIVERETTAVLLDLMAEEKDRKARIFYLELVKDIGKNQIALFGECLSDGRWYVIRNIISILGETKTEQAISFLRKAADHKDVRIRQEVIRGLLTIGGRKAASVLARFLRDKDLDIQVMAVRSFADLKGISAEDSKPLVSFLKDRPLKKKEKELTLEAIRALGRIGGRDAEELLHVYDRIRWWKPRKLQLECRTAAQQAVMDITRRLGNVG
jgi:hypothetical protein